MFAKFVKSIENTQDVPHFFGSLPEKGIFGATGASTWLDHRIELTRTTQTSLPTNLLDARIEK
jgi:hypothetical protein